MDKEKENKEILEHNKNNVKDCPVGIGRDFCNNCDHSYLGDDYEPRCELKKPISMKEVGKRVRNQSIFQNKDIDTDEFKDEDIVYCDICKDPAEVAKGSNQYYCKRCGWWINV